jgi:hypothetical protein
MTDFLVLAEKYYFDWINNYLTVEKFAEHNQLAVKTAQKLIDFGRHVSVSDNKGSELY